MGGRKQMTWICDSLLVLLFLMSVKICGRPNLIVLIWSAAFEGYLLLTRKKLGIDIKFVLLSLCMVLHTFIYNRLVSELSTIRMLELALLPPLFYLLGKQLVWYPQESNISIRRVHMIIAAILIGQFLLSILNLYTYFKSPSYPYRIWSDFWKGETIYATQYSFFAIIWVSLLFYALWILHKRRLLGLGLLSGILAINVFNILNGNRMHLGVMIVVFAFCTAFFCLQNRKNTRLFMTIILSAVFVLAVFLITIGFNIGNIREIPYIERFLRLATNERIGIYKDALRQMPVYLWGGGKMDLGRFAHAHNMWLQMYNDSGIITFILMCLFTILSVGDHVRLLISKHVETELKYIVPPVCLGLGLYLSFELGGRAIPDYIVFFTFFAGMAAQIAECSKNG